MTKEQAEALDRLEAYLNEMDRVDSKTVGMTHYDDTVHGINDLELRRSDIRTLIELQKENYA